MNILALSPAGWALLVVGVLLIVYGATKFFIPHPVSLGARGIIAVVGIIFLVAAFAVAPNVSTPTLQSVPPSPPSSPQTSVSFSSIVGATYSASTNTFKVTVSMSYNATSKLYTFTSPTGGKVSFDAIVNSLSVNTTFPSVVFNADPSIANSTNAADNNYLFVPYTSNNSMEVDVALPQNITHSDISLSGATYLFPLKAAGTSTVGMTYYLSTQGLLNLYNNNGGAGSQIDYTFSLAGQTYTIDVIIIAL